MISAVERIRIGVHVGASSPLSQRRLGGTKRRGRAGRDRLRRRPCPTRCPRPSCRFLSGRSRASRSRPAAVLGRPRHQRHGEVDPGALRGRDRDADGGPRPARRGLRRRRRQGRDLGAVEAGVVDAREEFANDYVLPAIRANGSTAGLSALHRAGRPLIAKLAVQAAREHGCDTIAHGCTGKGNDQCGSRHDRDAGSRAEGSSPRCASGRWGARRRSPTRASRASPRAARRSRLLDRRQPLGALLRGPRDRGPRGSRLRRRLPAGHPARGGAR